MTEELSTSPQAMHFTPGGHYFVLLQDGLYSTYRCPKKFDISVAKHLHTGKTNAYFSDLHDPGRDIVAEVRKEDRPWRIVERVIIGVAVLCVATMVLSGIALVVLNT